MGNLKDLTGQKFGRLTVMGKQDKTKDGHALWECLCDCGTVVVVRGRELRNGHTKSCGCLRKIRLSESHKTHGQTNTKLFSVWQKMRYRCSCKNRKDYAYYGGRGIIVCDEWKNDFQAFYDWAMDNGYREGLTLDRIDNNGNYYPENCRWVTMKEQCNNRRSNNYITYNGKTQTLQQWAEEYGIARNKLSSRIHKLHWDIEKALTTK